MSDVTCPHGLRPGTTVCLRCRQEARAVARQRRNRAAVRAGLLLMSVALAVALGVGAWNAIVSAQGDSAETVIATSGAAAPRLAAQSTGTTPPPALQPIIAEGRRELGDSMFAVREGRQVTVHFDTDSLRTRFDWKFEGVVRATLPILFGPEVQAALDSIPQSYLARGGLLTELPQRGIPLKLGTKTLRVWPITREGRDGPLVVGYRAAPSP